MPCLLSITPTTSAANATTTTTTTTTATPPNDDHGILMAKLIQVANHVNITNINFFFLIELFTSKCNSKTIKLFIGEKTKSRCRFILI